MRPRQSILICESDPYDADLLSFVVRTMGKYKVTTVSCAYDAIETISHREFRLVLTNQLLRGSDGLDLARRIKERWPDQAVMVYSAHKGRARRYDSCANSFIALHELHNLGPMLREIYLLSQRKRGPKPDLTPTFTMTSGRQF